jgi:hypothetical protein
MLYMKAVGRWTRGLYNDNAMLSHEKIPEGTMVTSSPSPTLLVATPLPLSPLTLSIRGPFGAPAQNYAAYQHIVVIGSGIGVTPLLFMWKYLVNHMKAATTTTTTATTTTIVTGAAATTIFDSEDATDANINVNDNRNINDNRNNTASNWHPQPTQHHSLEHLKVSLIGKYDMYSRI